MRSILRTIKCSDDFYYKAKLLPMDYKIIHTQRGTICLLLNETNTYTALVKGKKECSLYVKDVW